MGNNEVIIALLSFIGTCVGSFGGIITATRLTNYRLKLLEQKVDKHNHFASRLPTIELQIESIHQRLNTLERLK